MSASSPTVHVVDDDVEILDSMKLLLESHEVRTQIYQQAEDFLRNYDPQALGCVVLDVNMPGMDGLELQSELAAIGSLLPIIFLSGHADVPIAVKALKSGAYDFLQKPCSAETLWRVVSEALAYNARQQDELRQRQTVEKRLEKLTRRETEVLNYVVDGHPNKFIAIELELSPRTVEIYRSNVMLKMQVDSLAQLVKLVSGISRPGYTAQI